MPSTSVPEGKDGTETITTWLAFADTVGAFAEDAEGVFEVASEITAVPAPMLKLPADVVVPTVSTVSVVGVAVAIQSPLSTFSAAGAGVGSTDFAGPTTTDMAVLSERPLNVAYPVTV